MNFKIWLYLNKAENGRDGKEAKEGKGRGKEGK
jgi:hypothetical protein